MSNKAKANKTPQGRPRGSVSANKKVVMTFRIAQDVALFLESAKMEGRNKTLMIENAVRQTYFNTGRDND